MCALSLTPMARVVRCRHVSYCPLPLPSLHVRSGASGGFEAHCIVDLSCLCVRTRKGKERTWRDERRCMQVLTHKGNSPSFSALVCVSLWILSSCEGHARSCSVFSLLLLILLPSFGGEGSLSRQAHAHAHAAERAATSPPTYCLLLSIVSLTSSPFRVEHSCSRNYLSARASPSFHALSLEVASGTSIITAPMPAGAEIRRGKTRTSASTPSLCVGRVRCCSGVGAAAHRR